MNEVRPAPANEKATDATVLEPSGGWRALLAKEDWWAIWIGAILLLGCLVAVLVSTPAPTGDGGQKVVNRCSRGWGSRAAG